MGRKLKKDITEEFLDKYLDPIRKRKPSRIDSYAKVRDFFANSEYSKNFIANVANEIKDMYKLSRAISVLGSLKKFHVYNKENFFEIYSTEKARDLGTCAYIGNENDLMG